jgi:hypothetical protein
MQYTSNKKSPEEARGQELPPSAKKKKIFLKGTLSTCLECACNQQSEGVPQTSKNQTFLKFTL